MQALDCRVVTSLWLACTQKSTGIDQASSALVQPHVVVRYTRAPLPDQVSRCSTIYVDVGVRCTPKSTGIGQAYGALVQRHLGALHKSTLPTRLPGAPLCVYIELWWYYNMIIPLWQGVIQHF